MYHTRMRGMTKKIRELGLGETIVLDGFRDNIYRIARNEGITVKVEKFIGGFYVTKTGNRGAEVPSVQPEAVAVEEFDFGA